MGVDGLVSRINFIIFMDGKMNYPYKCKTCNTKFTVEMSVREYETIKVVVCPVCKSKEIKRTFYSQGIAIHYKDNGFTKYVGE